MRQAIDFDSGRPFFDEPGPDFATFGVGRRQLYLRKDFAAAAPAILLDSARFPSRAPAAPAIAAAVSPLR